MDAQRYALLLDSVARQGTGSSKRPLTPVECAEDILRLMDEEEETREQVAERLNLGNPNNRSNMYKKRDTTMISSFLNLLKVSPKSRGLTGWGTEDYPKIPFSTISQLASFTHEEQDIILQSVFGLDGKKILGKEDVKNIRKWRNDNPDAPIQECVSKVLKLKPVTKTTHMVVCDIRENLLRLIGSDDGYQDVLLNILRKRLEGEFYSVDAGQSVVAISMDARAYGAFRESQHNKGVSYTLFLEKVLKDGID